MKKQIFNFFFILSFLFLTPHLVQAEGFWKKWFGKSNPPEFTGPCAAQQSNKYNSRQILNDCIKTWSESRKSTDKEPSDNCQSHLSNFIQTTRDLAVCRTTTAKKN